MPIRSACRYVAPTYRCILCFEREVHLKSQMRSCLSQSTLDHKAVDYAPDFGMCALADIPLAASRAGIIPYTVLDGQLTFLMGLQPREAGKTAGRRLVYSDFGGQRSGKETPMQTALRELKEESRGCLIVQRPDFTHMMYTGKTVKQVFFFVHVAHDATVCDRFAESKSSAVTKAELENDHLEWISYTKFMELTEEHLLCVLVTFRNKLRKMDMHRLLWQHTVQCKGAPHARDEHVHALNSCSELDTGCALRKTVLDDTGRSAEPARPTAVGVHASSPPDAPGAVATRSAATHDSGHTQMRIEQDVERISSAQDTLRSVDNASTKPDPPKRVQRSIVSFFKPATT